ncbi:MAG: hypothetical protein GZ091_04155 [Paludibacter sp.]|nr:hypothetical protein [Paludibacter sp.]
MKNKYIYRLFLMLSIVLLAVSCKQPEPEDSLSLSVASIIASADANTYQVNVTTTVSDFTALSDADWCAVSSDISKKNITIVVSKNELTISRKAKITVTAGTKTAFVSVTQAAAEAPVYTKTKRDSMALIALNTGETKWDKTVSMNSWSGVKVEMIDGVRRVTELNVPSAGFITGAFSDSIKNLTELLYLDLSGNNLTNSIPSLVTLNKLIVIDLKNNKLTGVIPTLPISLAYISFGQNNLSGALPLQIKDLTGLMVFDLGLNDLTGSIPAEWSTLTKLRYFYLYGNLLSGTIPAYIASFSKLESLALDYNQLTGEIPAGIGSINSLLKLYLQQNKLTGSIPADLLNNTHWLEWKDFVLPQQNNTTLSAVNSSKYPTKYFRVTSLEPKIQIYPLPEKKYYLER